ncbi:MAG: Hint domain-containing protein [Pseudomonadota bacterium]
MPNINGTNNADDIDVTSDNGTLNGTPQGTPIDNIRGRGGNDTISVDDSTISNSVRGNGGSDDITVSGSTVSGVVAGGQGADTVSIQGSNVGNIRLGGGNDTLDFISSAVTGDVRGGSGTDTLNLPVGTVVNDSSFGTFTVTTGGTYSLSSGTFTLPSGGTITYSTFETGTGFPCFARNTLIETERGPVEVQHLRVGDTVVTSENGRKDIRWIGQRAFSAHELAANPKLRPVRITAGALGNGLPRRDLLVSRQHRMLVKSRIVARMFGGGEALLPAVRLTGMPGIQIDETVSSVEYFHLLLDCHEIIIAEGAPTESLFTGPEALKSLAPDAREEVLTIFPEAALYGYNPQPARHIPRLREQSRLVARHVRNKVQLLSDQV